MLDIAIIGAGPAGMTAGLYAARAGFRTALIEKLFPGGQVATTATVENYPGFPGGIGGPELAAKLADHAQEYGLELLYEEVTGLSLDGKVKTLQLGATSIEARAVVLCMGATPRMLGIPGEARLRGAGVSYCATCDGALFRGKRVAIVGGGDTAAEDAAYLSPLCAEVLLIHRRDTLRAAGALAERTLALPNLRPIWNTSVTEILGNAAVEGIALNTAGETRVEPIDAVFIAVGTTPCTESVRGIVALNKQGYILAGEDTRTPVPLVYAAGDIREKPLRQIVTAVSDGAVAIHSAQSDLAAMA